MAALIKLENVVLLLIRSFEGIRILLTSCRELGVPPRAPYAYIIQHIELYVNIPILSSHGSVVRYHEDMFESFRRKKVEADATSVKEDLSVRIAEIEAHIQSGNNTSEDAMMLDRLRQELADMGE